MAIYTNGMIEVLLEHVPAHNGEGDIPTSQLMYISKIERSYDARFRFVI